MNDTVMQAESNNSILKFDPRTKLLLLIMINVTIFSSDEWFVTFIMGAIPIILLAISKKVKSAIICGAALSAATLSNELLVPITHGALNIIVVMFSGMVYRMMPGLIMGYYLVSTTTVSEFIASMERMKVPKSLTISLSVMFRFFPTVFKEASSINDAMRMRGISVNSRQFFSNPTAILEYRLVPMMMSTVKIGDELSAASLTRGLGNPDKRTNICKIGFGWHDFVLLLVGTTVFIAYFVV